MKVSLEQYLFRNRMSVRYFAESIGYAPQYVTNIKNWKMKPGKKFLRDVSNFTKGEVTFDPELICRDAVKDQYDECPCCHTKLPKKSVLAEAAN